MKTCPKCGGSNPDDAVFCGACGADLSGVTPTAGAPRSESFLQQQALRITIGHQQVALPVPWIVIGVVGLLAFLCLLVLSIVGLVGTPTSEVTMVVLSVTHSLVGLYAFLLAILGGYILVSKMDLARLFSPVKGWMRFLVFIGATGLFYLPLSFIFERLFTFVSRTNHIVYSLERIAEAGFLVIVFAVVFWLLLRREAR